MDGTLPEHEETDAMNQSPVFFKNPAIATILSFFFTGLGATSIAAWACDGYLLVELKTVGAMARLTSSSSPSHCWRSLRPSFPVPR